MTEEVKVQNTGTEVPGEAKPLSRVQEEAISQGWVPRDEFQGEDDEFIDAAEFVRRGELFRKIESQSKQLKEQNRAIKALADHNARIAEIEYKRAVAELKAQKKEALSEGDAERVVEIDEQIDLVKEQQRIQQAQQIQNVVPEVHPEFTNWVSKNPWYESNPEMRKFADRLGAVLAGEMAPQDVLKEVEKEVKSRFKDKFTNPNRAKASAVEAPSRNGRASDAEPELSDVEKQVMKTLVDGGHITREEYLKQLKAVKQG